MLPIDRDSSGTPGMLASEPSHDPTASKSATAKSPLASELTGCRFETTRLRLEVLKAVNARFPASGDVRSLHRSAAGSRAELNRPDLHSAAIPVARVRRVAIDDRSGSAEEGCSN